MSFKVLVVEDNMINQEVMKGYLAAFSADVVIAEDGSQALVKLNEDDQFDLVFMDCQMPVMDGYEATRRIRGGEAGDQYAKVPIIAMTANAMKGDRERCLESGMDDYYTKPIEPNVITEIIEKWGNRD